MKNLLLIFCSLFSATIVCAQDDKNLYDDKVDMICGFIQRLHNAPDRYDDVYREMRELDFWRLMDEFYDNCSDTDAMCRLWDDVAITGINDRAFQAEQYRGTRPQTTDNFCAGNETRYRYSFYECAVKVGHTVRSVLSGRFGKQLFLFVPYNQTALDFRLSVNGVSYPVIRNADGIWESEVDESVNGDDDIVIEIENVSSLNQSVVIVNHNSSE